MTESRKQAEPVKETALYVEVKEAGFSYGKSRGGGYGAIPAAVFENVSFSVNAGECLAVLGPNGAGKTTLLRTLGGMLTLSAGEIRILGRDLREVSRKGLYGILSYVPQKSAFVPSCTVTEEVLLGLSAEVGAFGAPGEEALSRVEETLALLGISGLSGRTCDTLSGGEFRMVLIARAMVSEPKIILLDEPESGLDFKNRLTVLGAISKLKARGTAVIFNTHHPEDALRVADTALLLYGGGTQYERGAEIAMGRSADFGRVAEIITAEKMTAAFGVETLVGTISDGEKSAGVAVPYRVIS